MVVCCVHSCGEMWRLGTAQLVCMAYCWAAWGTLELPCRAGLPRLPTPSSAFPVAPSVTWCYKCWAFESCQPSCNGRNWTTLSKDSLWKCVNHSGKHQERKGLALYASEWNKRVWVSEGKSRAETIAKLDFIPMGLFSQSLVLAEKLVLVTCSCCRMLLFPQRLPYRVYEEGLEYNPEQDPIQEGLMEDSWIELNYNFSRMWYGIWYIYEYQKKWNRRKTSPLEMVLKNPTMLSLGGSGTVCIIKNNPERTLVELNHVSW